MLTTAIVSTAYLPPIAFFKVLTDYPTILMEEMEHFPKQTYRNRCEIYGANGLLTLSIPLEKNTKRTLTKDIRISYSQNWQHIHWLSLQAAYRRSPFFEFYEDDFAPFYESKKNIFLKDFNDSFLELLLQLLKINPSINNTISYEKEYPNAIDLRNAISPKKNAETFAYQSKNYTQVFENKHGFIPNLSIVDLLFNQ
ncbi:MAG TPA: WbqC family protein [Bacteroidia bacterium]|nr:WbqC family protein [Bacteroidia bacterium]